MTVAFFFKLKLVVVLKLFLSQYLRPPIFLDQGWIFNIEIEIAIEIGPEYVL